VEELCDREAPMSADSLKNFMKAQEEAHTAAMVPPERNVRMEPKLGVSAATLFSHGREFGTKFEASMSALHFADPASKGFEPSDRVYQTYYWGSKHIDARVPQNDPNPRMQLTGAKQAQWASEQPPRVPVATASYLSESQKAWVPHAAAYQPSLHARKAVL